MGPLVERSSGSAWASAVADGNRRVTLPSGCSSGVPNRSTRRAVCVACGLQRDVLAEHRSEGELVAVDTAGHAQPRPGADEATDHLVSAQRPGDRQRVGVEVEQAPAAGDCRGEIPKVVEAERAADGTPFRGQLDHAGAVREGE